MDDFIESADEAFGEQLNTHKQGMSTYGTLLGFTNAEKDRAADDAAFWDYLLQRQASTLAYKLELSDFKKLVRKGNGDEVLPAAIPEPQPNPLPLPTLTAANIEGHLRTIASRAKVHPAYTHNIGQALRIVKSAAVFDPEAGQPLLKIDLNAAGHPHLSFKKGGWQGIELHKMTIGEANQGPAVPPIQNNDPRFVKLERIFGHDYVDPSELPAGKAEIWIYKALYLYKNLPVGTWSQLALVTVGGV
jgi:hypothetical protein